MKLRIRKICFLFALITSLCNPVYATTKGVYIGVGGGYGTLSNFDDTEQEDNGGPAGTIFAGYNFTPHLGIEGGYRQFSSTTYKVDGYTNATFNYKLSGVTVMLKGYFFDDNSHSPFNLYAGLGAAQVYGKGDILIEDQKLASTSNSIFTVAAAFGLSYDITQRFTSTAEWSFMGGQSGDDNNIGIPRSNLFTLNMIARLT